MSFDHKTMTDGEFERALLASADNDAPPHDTGSAWTRFASMAGLDTSASPPGAGEPRSDAPREPTIARGRSDAPLPDARRGVALKWLLVGSIAGSVITAAIVRQSRPTPDQAGPSAPVAAGATGPATKADAICATAPDATQRPVAVAAPPGLPHPGRHAKRAHGSRMRAQAGTEDEVEKDETDAADTTKASSTLAAEVARIDAARAALTSGDYDQAVRLVEQYHWDFPAGNLAPDADVVALEAVAAKHDRVEVTRRAALFLSRYPGDPHAARVMWLAGH